MLLIFIQILTDNLTTGFLCCDDDCHLKKFARNQARIRQTPIAIRLVSLNMVIGKTHFKGHTDQWCHQSCNPYSFCELENVQIGYLPNTQSLMSFTCFVLSLFLGVTESE